MNTPNTELVDGATVLQWGLNNVEVTVQTYPISDRYCYDGAVGLVRNGQIRVTGCWFDFDNRWMVWCSPPTS